MAQKSQPNPSRGRGPISEGRGRISEARRTQILEAAVRVIGERGLCDSRISDIAREAGASSALVVYYFGSKERLLGEALAFSEERFYGQTAEELESIPTATGQLIKLIELSCASQDGDQDVVDEWVLWLDLWARAAHKPDVARDRLTMDRRWRTTIGEIVRQGQAAGEFAPVDVDTFALRLAALIDGLAILVVLQDPEVNRERMFDLCMDTCARELGFSWTAEDRSSLVSSPERATSG